MRAPLVWIMVTLGWFSHVHADGRPGAISAAQAKDLEGAAAAFEKLTAAMIATGKCEKTAAVIEADTTEETRRLGDQLRAVNFSKDADVQQWARATIVPRIAAAARALRASRTWKACKNDPAVYAAGRKHALVFLMFQGISPKIKRPAGVSAATAKLAEAGVARVEALAARLRAVAPDCPRATRIAKADNDATARKLMKVRESLQDSKKREIADWYIESHRDRLLAAAGQMAPVWRACRNDRAFMSAAKAHPLLAPGAAMIQATRGSAP